MTDCPARSRPVHFDTVIPGKTLPCKVIACLLMFSNIILTPAVFWDVNHTDVLKEDLSAV